MERNPELLPKLRRRALLALPLAAAACAAPGRPRRTSFPPLDYRYLTKLRLNVARIDIGDAPPPVPGSLDALAPVRPGVALRSMARERLVPGGAMGSAAFTVDEAVIIRTADGYDGVMAVHLDVLTGEGTRAGFAEARVSRRRTGGDPDEDIRGVLYDLTRAMMDDMNVEFEFQVRRALRDWLQETTTAPAPAPVERQDLPAL